MGFKLNKDQIRETVGSVPEAVIDASSPDELAQILADKASAHTAWAIVDFLQNNGILKHKGIMRLARHLHAEGIVRPDVPETKFRKTEPLPDDEDEHICTGCQYDGTCAYQEGEMADGDCGDFRHNINDCLHYEPKIDHIVDTNKKICTCRDGYKLSMTHPCPMHGKGE